MQHFKSSAARLARLFQASRDKWKARAAEVHKRWRAAQVRIRDLEKSRAYWKARALAAEQEQATRVCTDKPCEDEDTPSAPCSPHRWRTTTTPWKSWRCACRWSCTPASVVVGSAG